MKNKTYGYLHHRQFPYYKVQWYDEVSMCWRVIEKAHATQAAATAACPSDRKCRVVEVNETGREVVA